MGEAANGVNKAMSDAAKEQKKANDEYMASQKRMWDGFLNKLLGPFAQIVRDLGNLFRRPAQQTAGAGGVPIPGGAAGAAGPEAAAATGLSRIAVAAIGFGLAIEGTKKIIEMFNDSTERSNRAMKGWTERSVALLQGDFFGAKAKELKESADERRAVPLWATIFSLGLANVIREGQAKGYDALLNKMNDTRARQEAVMGRAQNIAYVSPEVSQANAMSDYRKTLTDIAEANAIGKDLARSIGLKSQEETLTRRLTQENTRKEADASNERTEIRNGFGLIAERMQDAAKRDEAIQLFIDSGTLTNEELKKAIQKLGISIDEAKKASKADLPTGEEMWDAIFNQVRPWAENPKVREQDQQLDRLNQKANRNPPAFPMR